MPSFADILSNFVKNVTDFGLERVFKRYYSVYRAQVTSIDDPLKRGRIKVKLPNVFGDDELPYFAEPRDFRGAGAGKGEFYPPEVDDWVFVEFEMGDPKLPLYSGGWHGNDELSEEFAHVGDAPAARGFQSKYGHVMKFVDEGGKERFYVSTPKGNFLILDDSEGAEGVYLIHKTGAQLQIDADGGIKIVGKDGAFVILDAASGALTVSSKDGSTVALTDSIVMLPKGGDTLMYMKEGLAQITSAGDITCAGQNVTVAGGAITLDTLGAKLALGNGKVALGVGPVELVDQVIQLMDALLTTPSLCTTGTGPSGPLSPPASVTIATLKGLLTAIKGTL